MTTALSEAQLPQDVARVVVGQGFDVVEAAVGMIGIAEGNEIRILDRRRFTGAAEAWRTAIARRKNAPDVGLEAA